MLCLRQSRALGTRLLHKLPPVWHVVQDEEEAERLKAEVVAAQRASAAAEQAAKAAEDAAKAATASVEAESREKLKAVDALCKLHGLVR